MTIEEFVKAVLNMRGLPLPHVEQLLVMSYKMDDDQRKDIVDQMTPINEQILENRKEEVEIAQEEAAEAEAFAGELSSLLEQHEKDEKNEVLDQIDEELDATF